MAVIVLSPWPAGASETGIPASLSVCVRSSSKLQLSQIATLKRQPQKAVCVCD